MAHAHHAHAKDAFPQAVLDRIAAAIAEAEKHTSAEIRVSIHDQRDSSESGKSVADVAKSEFVKLHMDELPNHNGILLLILYSERQFYIYADAAIHSRVHPEAWADVAATLGSHLKDAHYEEGVTNAISKMTHHLKNALP
ncbi:MAG TPA: TPM domain-containing protein, partial [Steroidobacteraceae bacterium]|nr:TPM domain-containing protein [Steroidobacteraceae bacterium]